jgi:hypothetical protein
MVWLFHRMNRSKVNVAIMALITLCVIGLSCARNGVSPVAPDTLQNAVPQQDAPSRVMLGYYEMAINADHSEMSVTPLRTSQDHLNVLGILQAYDPKSVTLGAMFIHPDNTITVEVKLTHPLPTELRYTAFDIRGILMLPTENTFPIANLRLPGFFPGESALLNPDGYTRRWNPSEFSKNSSPFNYFDGFLIPKGLGAGATSQINPYRCFYTNTNRRYFKAGGTDTRQYHVSFPPGPMVFGYAVDASWGEPTKDIDPTTHQPNKVPGSFQLTANSIEPYDIRLSAVQGEMDCSLGSYAGGTVSLSIAVNDWKTGAYVQLTTVNLEAPDLFDGIVHPWTGTGNATTSFAYEAYFTNTKAVTPGIYPVLFSMEVPEGDPYFLPDVTLCAYQVFLLEVKEINPPFCNNNKSIHNTFSGSYMINGSPGALHMDCSFMAPKVGGTGGLLFDGGIQGGNEFIQAASIPSAGGSTSASTLFKRNGLDAGRALVMQTDDYTGNVLLVTDADADNLLVYSTAGALLKEYDLGDGDDGKNEPVCLTVNNTNGDIWFIGDHGSQGIGLEHWTYIKEGSVFEYLSHPLATVDLAPWLGSNPKPLGIAVNGDMNRIYILHAADQGSIETFEFSTYPPTHLDKYSVKGVFGKDVVPTTVNNLRKLIGGDIIIDHADGESLALCRMLAFANTSDGGSKLVRLDGWCQTLNSSALGSPFSCMALNNLPGVENRTLVLFPNVPSVTYVAFLAPGNGW